MSAYITVGSAESVPEGSAIRVDIDGTPVAIFHAGGRFYAIGDTCTHEEASLSEGELVDEYTVECPLHGAQFDIRSGKALCLPATVAEETFEVVLEDGLLKVRAPD
jgi:3-phenylpropionate/trans-cinnamate dioxygenase ferredoxin subunit